LRNALTHKIKTQTELAAVLKSEKASGKVIGFTNGCFDILHPGHVEYLNAAKKECDLLIIGVNSDGSVKRLKGDTRPINHQDARAKVLSALESVDFLTLFEEDTPEELIKSLNPDILFKGGDWKEEDIAGADFVKANGGKVRVIAYVKGFSTTKLIEKLRESE